jgi:hypothetical protein
MGDPWFRLAETTDWADFAAECRRLGYEHDAAEIETACRGGGFTPRESIGVLRGFWQRNFKAEIASDISRMAAEEHGNATAVIARLRDREHGCPPSMRRIVIAAFDQTCEHCGGMGGATTGPDGKPWHVDRIDPRRVREYTATNVTLACATCNMKRRCDRAPLGARSLGEVQVGRARTIGYVE